MNEDSIKKLLNEALEPIRNDLGTVKGELGSARTDLGSVKIDLGSVRTELKSVATLVEKINDTQENQVLPSVINTEAVLKGYADAYKINKGNIERLDERVAKLEENSDIIIPSELVIHR